MNNNLYEKAKNKKSDLSKYRDDFPALNQNINGNPIIYLDSAASSQQPTCVIDAISKYSKNNHANVHRGVHTLSHRATDAYENSREKISKFINARNLKEIVFTSGTTESINLVAQSFCRPNLKKGDKILITHIEHHSNIVPWQIICEETGATLEIAPVDKKGQIQSDELISLLNEKVKLLAVTHVSNALGTINPIEEWITAAKELDIPVLIDGAQAIPHMPIDVQKLDCDFYTFSGHKMLGPTGIGVLYGKENKLESMPPWQAGGDMILEVSFSGTTYNELPYKFEAGTPNISGVIGLGEAVSYLSNIGMKRIKEHEHSILNYLVSSLEKIQDIRLIGTALNKAAVQSFLLGDVHPHDIGTILDSQGVAIRTGHHCAMPLMQYFGIPGTARASLSLYNNKDDVDRLIDSFQDIRKIFFS